MTKICLETEFPFILTPSQTNRFSLYLDMFSTFSKKYFSKVEKVYQNWSFGYLGYFIVFITERRRWKHENWVIERNKVWCYRISETRFWTKIEDNWSLHLPLKSEKFPLLDYVPRLFKKFSDVSAQSIWNKIDLNRMQCPNLQGYPHSPHIKFGIIFWNDHISSKW